MAVSWYRGTGKTVSFPTNNTNSTSARPYAGSTTKASTTKRGGNSFWSNLFSPVDPAVYKYFPSEFWKTTKEIAPKVTDFMGNSALGEATGEVLATKTKDVKA